jgi:pimeloyl-ACP methyl ester carboxylesterase
MANRTVALLRYAKILQLGWRRGAAVIGKTGRVKPDYMVLNREEIHCPDGYYEVRVYKGRRPSYRNVGNDPSDALQARDKEEKILELRNAVVDIPESKSRRTLYQLREESPEQSVVGIKIPILLIHGLADHNIPPRQSEMIRDHNPADITLWEVPNAGHCGACDRRPRGVRWSGAGVVCRPFPVAAPQLPFSSTPPRRTILLVRKAFIGTVHRLFSYVCGALRA